MRNFYIGLGLAVLGGGIAACGSMGGMAMESRAAPGVSMSGGETYQDYGEGEVFDTRQDTTVTLSLDVDTASYTLMRRDLRAGTLPAAAGVRVEEYLNFFEFEDEGAVTDNGDPILVSTETASSPFRENVRLMRIAVRAREIPTSQRPEANVVFLVDVSGSMGTADKIGLVKYSLSTLLDGLRPDDHISIVTYAGADAVVLPPTRVMHRARILDAIHGLGTGGGTNGAAGIRTAYDLAAQHLATPGINRVVLCTDGDFNVGVTGDELIEMIERQRERQITLSVLGFGSGNINDRDMERLADHGNGNYAYIDNQNEALRVLARDLEGTLSVVAKDVKIQLEFDPAQVASYRLVGYENRTLRDQDFANDQVDAAEVGSGDFVTVLVEYERAPNAPAGPLGELRVRYKEPDSDQSERRAFAMDEDGGAFEQASESLRFSAAVAEFAQRLRGSEHAHGSFAQIRAIAETATGQSDERREFLQLVARADELSPN